MSSWEIFQAGDAAGIGSGSAVSSSPNSSHYVRPASFPNGLVGDIAEFIYHNAYYPNETIAIVAAIGLLAGIMGRSYNVRGSGLNLYLLLLAPTGTGKEAISEGISRLMTAVSKLQDKARLFRGPGELVSAPGLIKWLARLENPSAYSVIGEFGFMLQTMTGKNPNPNMKSLKGVLLKLYHKSGFGAEFDDIAYSDKDNNPGVLKSPAYTLIGEGTPSSVYNWLDASNIADGFLSRFNIFETNAPRPYLNERRTTEPSEQLVEDLAKLVGTAHAIGHGMARGSDVCNIRLMPDAESSLASLERETTDYMNRTDGEATKQLWNRALIKTRRLAAIVAVGRNITEPVLTLADVHWAKTIVHAQTVSLIGKFDNGDMGEISGNEQKQEQAVLRCISEYLFSPPDRFASYGLTKKMYDMGSFTQTFISKRVRNMPAFDDGISPTKAIERTLNRLAVAGTITPLDTGSTIEHFGTRARAFQVLDPVSLTNPNVGTP